MEFAFRLKFAEVPCDRCGSKRRVMGVACPDCGFSGRSNEVNASVVARRQAIHRVRELIGEVNPGADSPLPYYRVQPTVRSQLAKALTGVLGSLSRLAADPISEARRSESAAAIVELHRIGALLRGYSLRRPFVNDLIAKRAAAESLAAMTDAYLAAFEAALPLDAQALAKRAQSHIDEAVARMNDAENAQEIASVLGVSAASDFFRAAIDALSKQHPAMTLLQVDGVYRERLNARIGRPVAPGQGADFALAEVLAIALLDPTRFESSVAAAAQVASRTERLVALVDEPGALDMLSRARDAIIDSTRSFSAAIAVATTDESRFRRFIALYRELFEDAGTPLFAWFLRLAGVKSAPLSKLARQDSTALLKSIESTPEISSLFLGADRNIRTAASHGLGYTLDGDDVAFNLRSFSGTITVEALIDLLLALLESLLAAMWALDNELALLGIHGHNRAVSLLGASMLAVAEETLRIMNVEVLQAVESDREWRFILGDLGTVSPLIVASALVAQPVEGIDRVSVEVPNLPQGTLAMTAEVVQAFARGKNASKGALLLSNLELLSAATVDGMQVLDGNHVRRTAAIAIEGLVTDGDASYVPLLRRCRDVARTLAPDVPPLIDAAFRQWRSPDPIENARILRSLSRWSRLPTPALPLVRVTQITVK